MKRPYKLIFLIMIVIFALSIVRVGLENSISTTGVELSGLQSKVQAFKRENSILQEKYLEDSSLTHVASAAAEKGFVLAKNQVYLSAPLPLALKP